MRALVIVLALVGCGRKAGEKPASVASGEVTMAAAETAMVAPAADPEPPPNAAPDAPLPAGAVRRLGGTRFRHAGRVKVVAMSPDGTRVASGGGDNSLRVWNAATGELLYAPALKTFLDRVEDVVFAGNDTLVFASGDNPITVVSTKDWSERELTTCGKNWTRSLAASPDGKTVAVTCEYHDEVRLQPLDGSAYKAIRGMKRPDDLRWSADGAWIAVVSVEDHQIHLIDVAAGKAAKKVPGIQHSTPHVIAFAPAGAVLAYDDHDSYTQEEVVLYDVATDKKLGGYKTHVGAESIAFSSDGKTLAYAMATGERSLVRVDLATGRRTELMRPTRTVSAMAFQPGSATRLWIAHDDGIRLYDLAADAEVFGPAGHIGEITALAYRPDGKALASGSTDGTVRVWDLGTGKSNKLQVLTDEYGVILVDSDDDYQKFSLGQITGLAWSKDGATLHETDGFIGTGLYRRWDPATGAQLYAKHLQRYGIRAFGLAKDGTVATLGSDDDGNTVRIVNAATGKTLHSIGDVGDEDLAASPDGTKIAVTTPDTVRIVDAATGVELRSFGGSLAYALAFSPDGKRLAIGSTSDASVWDVETGTQLASIYAPTYVKSVAFAPDGRVICGTYRGGIIVARPGANLDAPVDTVEYEGHTGAVQAIAVAPDGKSFATGAVDGQILIWPL